MVRCGLDVVVEHLDTGALLGADDLLHELRGGDRDDRAVAARARRTAAAVQVGLGVAGRVEVDDQVDVVDVDAAGRDVGGDDGLGRAGREAVQVALADLLAEVAVQVDGVDALAGRGPRRSSTAPSRVRVKMMVRPLASTSRTATSTLSRKPPTVSVWWVIVVTEPALGSSSWMLRVAQVGADQLVDVTVERGAEQHPLRAGRGHRDQLVDGRVEAEVAQVVGLVEDGQLDVVEEAVAVLAAGPRAGPASRRRCRRAGGAAGSASSYGVPP